MSESVENLLKLAASVESNQRDVIRQRETPNSSSPEESKGTSPRKIPKAISRI